MVECLHMVKKLIAGGYTDFRENIYEPAMKAAIWFLAGALLALLTLLILSLSSQGVPILDSNNLPYISTEELVIFFSAVSAALFFAGVVLLFFASGLYAYIQIGRHTSFRSYVTEPRKLYELRLPETTYASIATMEALFESMAYDVHEVMWRVVWLLGKTRPTFSFEIVSRGGEVYFYALIPERMTASFFASLHALFPEVEIREADEYAFEVDSLAITNDIYYIDWGFTENSVLPIKTHLEFNMGPKSGKAKGHEIDPIAPLYDYLGTIESDEQIWMQFVFKKEKYPRPPAKFSSNPFEGNFWKRTLLREGILDALKEITKKEKEAREKGEDFSPSLSDQRLRAIGPRLAEKTQFLVGVRALHIMPKGRFRKDVLPPLMNVFKLTNSVSNSLNPLGRLLKKNSDLVTDRTFEGVGSPMTESETIRLGSDLAKFTQLYRDRMFWHGLHKSPYTPQTMTMSTETLATICHLPTSSIKTSTIRRTPAKTVEPPTNLPL